VSHVKSGWWVFGGTLGLSRWLGTLKVGRGWGWLGEKVRVKAQGESKTGFDWTGPPSSGNKKRKMFSYDSEQE